MLWPRPKASAQVAPPSGPFFRWGKICRQWPVNLGRIAGAGGAVEAILTTGRSSFGAAKHCARDTIAEWCAGLLASPCRDSTAHQFGPPCISILPLRCAWCCGLSLFSGLTMLSIAAAPAAGSELRRTATVAPSSMHGHRSSISTAKRPSPPPTTAHAVATPRSTSTAWEPVS